MKDRKPRQQTTRDRAILIGRLGTIGGAGAALGLTWLFSNLAAAYFSGKPPTAAVARPPKLPAAAAPVQKPPTVIQTVVHHPYGGPAAPAAGAAPRPPAQGPAPAPPPPAAPVCHSTPSKPC
jgi:hypothetical protein